MNQMLNSDWKLENEWKLNSEWKMNSERDLTEKCWIVNEHSKVELWIKVEEAMKF